MQICALVLVTDHSTKKKQKKNHAATAAADYRNTDGVDGLSRRNGDMLSFAVSEWKSAGVTTLPALALFKTALIPNVEFWNKRPNESVNTTHLQSIEELPVEVNDVRGARDAFLTRIALKQNQTKSKEEINRLVTMTPGGSSEPSSIANLPRVPVVPALLFLLCHPVWAMNTILWSTPS